MHFLKAINYSQSDPPRKPCKHHLHPLDSLRKEEEEILLERWKEENKMHTETCDSKSDLTWERSYQIPTPKDDLKHFE